MKPISPWNLTDLINHDFTGKKGENSQICSCNFDLFANLFTATQITIGKGHFGYSSIT